MHWLRIFFPSTENSIIYSVATFADESGAEIPTDPATKYRWIWDRNIDGSQFELSKDPAPKYRKIRR